MSNPYLQYYVHQVGSGIQGFSGPKYQRGYGFFSKLFQSAILPALKYLGRTVLSTGTNIFGDLAEGRDFKESLKDRGLAASKQAAIDALDRGKRFVQTGQGRKRRATKKKVTKRLTRKQTPAARRKRKATRTRRKTNKRPSKGRTARRSRLPNYLL